MNFQPSDLSVYHKQIEIIRLTAEQIQKDFQIFGEEISFSGSAETAYVELKSQILKIVSEMIKTNFEKFLSLLYRIDITEKKVKEISSSKNFEEIISEMIIERELKKVIVRKYYKQ